MAYTPYKVKFQGNTIAQFATASLAVFFVESVPDKSNQFIINYDNRKNVWDTAKEGFVGLNAGIINLRVDTYLDESNARFEKKMAMWDAEREAKIANR